MLRQIQEDKRGDLFVCPWFIFQVPDEAEFGKWFRLTAGRDVSKGPDFLNWLSSMWRQALSPTPAPAPSSASSSSSSTPPDAPVPDDFKSMVWTVPSGINSLRVFLPRSSLSSLQTIVNTLRQTDPSKRIHVWNMLGDPAVPFSTTFSKRPSGLLPLPPRDPREATAFFDTTFELDDEAVTEALRGVPMSGSWRRDGDSKVIFLFDSLENSKAWF